MAQAARPTLPQNDTRTGGPMPIYEYACHQCGREFEALVRSSTVPECPACHSTDLERQLSVFATAGSTADHAPDPSGACGSCGHPGGPGSCAFDGSH
jgi:putative FmdB family regulatory protein